MSKKEQIKLVAKRKAFGPKGPQGKKMKKPRVLNAQEKKALRMEGPVGQLVQLYEEFRRQECPNKQEIIQQVLDLQSERLLKTGGVPRFARIYQACAKHGNEAQLQTLLDAYKGHVLQMATSPYGNQLIMALLMYAKPAQRAALEAEILENSRGLIRCRFGQRILQRFYRSARPAIQRRVMINVFDRADLKAASDNGRLSVAEVWDKHPVIWVACAKPLGDVAERVVDRGLVDAPVGQELLDLAFRYGEHSKNVELVSGLKKALVHMCNSAPGCRVAQHCIRLGTPAQRADILGTFAQSVMDMASGRHSSFLLCTVVDVVDDVGLVRKAVLAELGAEAETLLTDPVAGRLLLHLLTPEASRKKKAFILPPIVQSLCHSERSDWDTLEVIEACTMKSGAAPKKTVRVCAVPWVQKHAAALEYLLPKVQAAFEADPGKYAASGPARTLLQELVHYAENVPQEWKGETVVDGGFLAAVKAALASPPAALPTGANATSAKKKRKLGKTDAPDAPQGTKRVKARGASPAVATAAAAEPADSGAATKRKKPTKKKLSTPTADATQRRPS